MLRLIPFYNCDYTCINSIIAMVSCGMVNACIVHVTYICSLCAIHIFSCNTCTMYTCTCRYCLTFGCIVLCVDVYMYMQAHTGIHLKPRQHPHIRQYLQCTCIHVPVLQSPMPGNVLEVLTKKTSASLDWVRSASPRCRYLQYDSSSPQGGHGVVAGEWSSPSLRCQ